jgi:flagellar assembly factor FliW
MDVITKFFGEVQIDESEVITFKEPIIGFEDDNEFILIDIVELDSLKCLQSVTRKELCFIVSVPWAYFHDYAFDITDETSELLELETEEDVDIYNILTMKDSIETSTINLLAPIIMNHKKNLASQIVINDGKYTSAHPIKGSDVNT